MEDLYLKIWAAVYLSCYFSILKTHISSLKPARRIFEPKNKILLLLPFILVLNGFSPYLGLKTDNSFSMYSNLRTEGGQSNHFLMGNLLNLAAYQTDLVRVEWSSDADIQKIADTRYPVTYYDFKNLLVRKMQEGKYDIELSFTRNGLSTSICNLKELEILPGPVPYFLQKFFIFRPIQIDGVVQCVH